MRARVITTSCHEVLYIPRAWDAYVYHGRVYRFIGDALVADYRTVVA